VTSQSPRDAEDSSAYSAYSQAWAAIGKLVYEEGGSWSGRERNCAFLNTGSLPFANVSAASGLDFPDDGRALAILDWDMDGKLDLLLRNRTAPTLRLMRNVGKGGGGFLSLELKGSKVQPDAIGARVTVEVGGQSFTKTVHAGDGYLAQSSRRLHFGTGQAEGPARVTVRWPDGTLQVFSELPLNAHWRLEKGASDGSLLPRAGGLSPKAIHGHLGPDPGKSTRAVVAAKLPLTPLPVSSWDRPGRRVGDLIGEPVLLVFWATWCTNCHRQFQDFEAASQALSSAGPRVVLMSTDEVSKHGEAQRQMEGGPWGKDAGPADLAAWSLVVDEIFGVSKEFPLPTSLLLDSAGQLVAIYRGPVDPEQLLRDTAIVNEMNPRTWHCADLSGGTWAGIKARDYESLKRNFLRAGKPRIAQFYGRLADSVSTGE